MIQFKLSATDLTLTIYPKMDYLYLSNLINSKFRTFSNLEIYTLKNESGTFTKEIKINTRYIKYISNAIEYLTDETVKIKK